MMLTKYLAEQIWLAKFKSQPTDIEVLTVLINFQGEIHVCRKEYDFKIGQILNLCQFILIGDAEIYKY